MPIVAAAVMPGLDAGAGVSWWQTVGGLAAVFALLIVFLKFLGRFQKGARHERATLLAVWSLGPRREIQVLRLGDEVHYIYRHDGAMVLLRQESHAAWLASGATTPAAPAGALPTWLRDRLPLLARRGAGGALPVGHRN
jgi:hypothetical protein